MDIFEKGFQHSIFNNFFNLDNDLHNFKIKNNGRCLDLDNEELVSNIYKYIQSINIEKGNIEEGYYIFSNGEVIEKGNVSENTLLNEIEFESVLAVSKDAISALALVNKNGTADIIISVDNKKVYTLQKGDLL